MFYNRNREDRAFYDSNGFIQRPSSLGLEIPRTYDVGYVGYNGDGHIGRLNLTVSAYGVFGKQTPGVFVRQKTEIRAGFAAAEASLDYNWIRLRGSLAGPAAMAMPMTTARTATPLSKIRSSPAPIPATGCARTCR